MRGVDALDLDAGEYTLTPSEESRNWVGRLTDVLDEKADDGDVLPRFDVVGPDGEPVLGVVKRKVRVGDEDDLMTRIEWHHEFVTPAGEVVMTLDEDATLVDADGEGLAQWGTSFPLVGSLQLLDPSGQPRATVSRDGSLLAALSPAADGSYTVTAPDGTDLAQFEYGRAEGGLADAVLSEMTVSLLEPAVPPELLLALAFAKVKRIEAAGGEGPH